MLSGIKVVSVIYRLIIVNVSPFIDIRSCAIIYNMLVIFGMKACSFLRKKVGVKCPHVEQGDKLHV